MFDSTVKLSPGIQEKVISIVWMRYSILQFVCYAIKGNTGKPKEKANYLLVFV